MKAEELKNYNVIITYNDDNHPSDVFVNGMYEGYLGDELTLIENLLAAGARVGKRPIIKREVWLFDLPELTDEETDQINNFFMGATIITLDQQVAIINRDYKGLLKLIK
jgi:hypothetical protein